MKESQIIRIEGNRYKVLNMTKFVEKSSYWIEYKLQNMESFKCYYLNVELSQKAILYEIQDESAIELKMNINFHGEEFSLFEKGQGKVETYYGLTDVAVGDVDEYYEYESKENLNRVLSIEKWRNITEISIGKVIKKSDIKILNEFDE
ncbi:MAG: DUF4178 domain-containing protein [Clostridia bacterium]|nr:DUF4178 domain-containing protein [Clostridia bacterium]